MASSSEYERLAKLLWFRRVFVSSTTRDLADVRAEVAQELKTHAFQVLMFDWGSIIPVPGLSPAEQCVRNVESADLFILLLSPRWGYEMPDGRSATEAEFDAAFTLGLPRFVYAREYVWSFVQAVRRAAPTVWEKGPLQEGKGEKIVRFYQKVADSGPNKIADFVVPFKSSVDLKPVLIQQISDFLEEKGRTKLTAASLKGLVTILGLRQSQRDISHCLRELCKLGYDMLGSLIHDLRMISDRQFEDVWDMVGTLTLKVSEERPQPASVVCLDKRIITPRDLHGWRKILSLEPSAGEDIEDLELLFARVPGHVWPAMHRFLTLTAEKWEEIEAIGRGAYENELQTLVNFLWQEYVREEISKMEMLSENQTLRFWATDTAFDDLSPMVWTMEDFHIALLNSTIKLAQRRKNIAYIAVRLSLVSSVRNLLVPGIFQKVHEFFKRHVEGGVTCGIVPLKKISSEFSACFKDFYLIPRCLLYRLLRKSSIHVLTTYEDTEGRSVLRQYERFYEHLLDIATFINATSLTELRSMLLELSEEA